jgi:hypothetical protein
MGERNSKRESERRRVLMTVAAPAVRNPARRTVSQNVDGACAGGAAHIASGENRVSEVRRSRLGTPGWIHESIRGFNDTLGFVTAVVMRLHFARLVDGQTLALH